MQNKFLLSVIVPAYQVEQYLDNCIQSVENQDFSDYEIIIIDDGSNDNTPIIADRLKEQYSNISVIHQKNQGLSEARNSGIKVAKGEYCVLLDGDDEFIDKSLKSLAECIKNNNMPDIVISRFVILDSKTGKIEDCSFTFNEKKLNAINETSLKFKEINHFRLAGCMFCVRLNYLKQYNLFFYKGLLHEDEEWMPKVALHARSIVFNNIPYYCYRLNRNGSITTQLNINRVIDSIKIVDLLFNESEKDTYTPQAKKVMLYRIQTILFGTINKVSLYKNYEDYEHVIKMLEQRCYILKDSQRLIYRISYIMCNLIGIKATGRIFQKLVEAKIYFNNYK